jgi:hypothetical protein
VERQNCPAFAPSSASPRVDAQQCRTAAASGNLSPRRTLSIIWRQDRHADGNDRVGTAALGMPLAREPRESGPGTYSRCASIVNEAGCES